VKLSRALVLLAGLSVGGTAAAQTSQLAQAEFKSGKALMDAKKPTEAADRFEAVTKVEPDFAAGWYALGAARRRAGQCDLAIPAYRRYAQMSPTEPEPYYGLGLCLKEAGQLASAAQALRRYIDLEKRPSSQQWVEHARGVIEEIGSSPDAPGPAASKPAAA
jgi:tetratricopeptide (TPR) repeat protein